VQVAGASLRTATRIMAGILDLVQMIRDGRTRRVLSSWMIERLGDVVCTLHHTRVDDERGFFC
jgi:hypothetical protein